MNGTGKRKTTAIRLCLLISGCLAVLSATPASALGPIVLPIGPKAVITETPPASTTARTATFAFKSTDKVLLGRFECRLDEGIWAACTSPQSYNLLGGGPHQFEVRLMGLLANGTPAKSQWLVARDTILRSCATPCANPTPPTPAPLGSKPKRYELDGCLYAGALVSQATRAQLARAVECLMSRYRVREGLSPVRPHVSLRSMARSKAADMTRHHYFGHTSVQGVTLNDRAQRFYLGGGIYGDLGEILAWGASRNSTPASALLGWLMSPTHKHVMRIAHFRFVGAGVSKAAPTGRYRNAATYAVEFGRRGRP